MPWIELHDDGLLKDGLDSVRTKNDASKKGGLVKHRDDSTEASIVINDSILDPPAALPTVGPFFGAWDPEWAALMSMEI